MHRQLFFICPTDYLETTIQDSFRHRNYFYTSLGNSVVFNEDTIYQIKHLIVKHGIIEISFVLSANNSIVKDSLVGQDYFEIEAMENFYNEIQKVKKRSDASWQIDNRQYLLLSYYLDEKIRLLRSGLSELFVDFENINGKIYYPQNNAFVEIYSSLIRREWFNLN